MTLKPLLAACVFLAASSLVFAGDPPVKLKGDLAKLQGKWNMKFGPDGGFEMDILFKEKSVTFSGKGPDGQAFEIKGEIKLDEEAKPHKTIDYVNFKGPDGNDFPDNLGIYAFDGDDKVKLCSGGPGQDRPTEFKTGEGPGTTITMTRKVEPEPKK